MSVLEAKSCGAETVPELVTSPQPVDTPPLVAVKVQSRLLQSSEPAEATLDGLTAQGNVGCDQLLCNDVNCTDVFTTGVDALGAVSCAALTATGAVAGATLSSTGAVSGSSLSITGAASVGLLSSATGSTLTINNTANRGKLRSHRCAHGRHADHHRGGPSP